MWEDDAEVNIGDIEMKEVKEVVGRLKRSKAAGLDGIPVEFSKG